jgi:protein-tyrosine kinase
MLALNMPMSDGADDRMSRFYRAMEEASRFHRVADLPQDPGGVTPPDSASESLKTDLKIASADSAVPDAAPPWQIIEEEWFGSEPVRNKGPLGILARVQIDKKTPLLSRAVDSAVLEHYRRLRTKIIQQQAVKPFRSLVVTSPNPQEGKTITTMNLGFIFAMLPSFRVLVVDGDLRRGSFTKCLGLDNQPGFSNLIDGSAKLQDVIFKSDDFPMNFMLRGNSKSPAAELLEPAQLRVHFLRMTEQFDLVLVDSPPLNVVTDTQLLAGSCDAVLLVARAFATTCKSLEKAAADIQPFRVIGTVLNGAKPRRLRRYSGYY